MVVEEDFASIEAAATNDTAESNGSNTISKAKARNLRRKRTKQRLKAAEHGSENANPSNNNNGTTTAASEGEKKKKKRKSKKKKSKTANDDTTRDTSPPSDPSNTENKSQNVRSASLVEVEKVPEPVIKANLAADSVDEKKEAEQPVKQVEIPPETLTPPAVPPSTIEGGATQAFPRSKVSLPSVLVESKPIPVPVTTPAPKSLPKTELKDVYHDDNVSEAAQNKKETCECSGCIIS